VSGIDAEVGTSSSRHQNDRSQMIAVVKKTVSCCRRQGCVTGCLSRVRS